MKNTLVVVADLGGFKAYRLDDNQMYRTPRLELLEQFHNPEAHERIVEKVTDFSGRFPRASGVMSDGERHNIELEQRKRAVRKIATRLNPLLRESERCFLAASRDMNRPLLDELEAAARGKITTNVPVDLTKVEKTQLMRHFA